MASLSGLAAEQYRFRRQAVLTIPYKNGYRQVTVDR